MSDRILTVKEVCAMLACSRSTLQRAVKAGKVPPPIRRAISHIGWRESDVVKFIQEAQ